jgi:hypothetical protein
LRKVCRVSEWYADEDLSRGVPSVQGE